MEKIIKVFKDGRKEEISGHGCAVWVSGENVEIDAIGTNPMDIIKITVALIELCIQRGIGEPLSLYLNQYFGNG